MFARLGNAINKFFREETLAERSKRMLPGAIYCAVAVTVYLLVSALINVIVYPGLHLGVDWLSLLARWLEYGLALALAGSIIAWFTETIEGVVWGGLILAALLMLGSMVLSLLSGTGNTLLGQSLITIIPVIGAGVLVAWVIRMAVKRHSDIMAQAAPKQQRKQLTQLVGIVLVVGLIPGVFSMFGTSSRYAIGSLNNVLQNYATDKLIESRFPYEQLPALRDHFGMDYWLYARTSSVASGSLDITVHFTDGYAFTCVVPQMNSNEPILLDACSQGGTYKAP
jgi:hypothetical protein